MRIDWKEQTIDGRPAAMGLCRIWEGPVELDLSRFGGLQIIALDTVEGWIEMYRTTPGGQNIYQKGEPVRVKRQARGRLLVVWQDAPPVRSCDEIPF